MLQRKKKKYLIYMDVELNKEFRKKCLEKEINYSNQIAILIEKWVNRGKKQEGGK